jgi:hypothetical protein
VREKRSLDQIINEKEGSKSEAYIWCFIREKFCKLFDSHAVLYCRWLCELLQALFVRIIGYRYHPPSTILVVGEVCPQQNFI